MSSFFGKAAHKFQPLPEDGKVNTDLFLKACSEIVPFFGKHGLHLDTYLLFFVGATKLGVNKLLMPFKQPYTHIRKLKTKKH